MPEMSAPILSLDETRRWLRVDHSEDDDLIQALILDATELVETRLRRPVISDDETALCSSLADVPYSVKLSALGIVALKYENRDATSEDVWNRLATNAGLDRFILWEA